MRIRAPCAASTRFGPPEFVPFLRADDHGARAQVQILDAGILAQGGELQPRGQFLAVTFGCLAVDKDARALFEREIVESGLPSLLFKRLGTAGQAESQQSVMGGSAFWSFLRGNGRRHECWRVGGGSLFGAFQEGTIEAGLEDRTE